MSLYTTNHSSFEVLPPDGATVGANRRRQSALCVLVGGLEVVVVGVVHVDAGALLGCAK